MLGSIMGAFVVYVCIWWVVIFMTLSTGNVEHDPEYGAPRTPQLKQKMLKTTLISAVIWAVVMALIWLDVFSFRPAEAKSATVPYANQAWIKSDSSFCQAVTRHNPDWSKDVHGRPVAPADLDDGTKVDLFADGVSVDIGVDLSQYLHLPNNVMPDQRGVIGKLNIGMDGNVTFNGKPLNPKQQDQLEVLCQQPDGAVVVLPGDQPAR